MKIMSRYFLAVLVLLFCMTGYSQEQPTTQLEGTVTTGDGTPLANVMVESFKTLDRTYTDANGSFSVRVISLSDQVSLSLDGFKKVSLEVATGSLAEGSDITMEAIQSFGNTNAVDLPYQQFSGNRSVSATNVVTGQELLSFPSGNLIEALAARLPGLSIDNVTSSGPGRETYFANVRGATATFYVDGIQRDPTYLSAYEVDRIYVFKDLSSRASMGISAAGPVIWILTRKGESYNREINVNVEYGVTSPTETPGYVDASDYAILRNEANANDGLAPQFSTAALSGYQDGSNPLRYPNVDYYGKYLNESTSFTRANVNFSGGDRLVNYFTMLDYTGTGGLEAVGEESRYDRYNARANVNLNLTDYISMNVNLAGSITDTRFPNLGGGSTALNLYSFLPQIPSNAHPNEVNGQLFNNANYTQNVENELTNGFGDGQTLNTQNNATLNVDLGSVLEGLELAVTGAFDVNNQIVEVKGGTSDLFRLTTGSQGQDSVFRFTQAAIDPSLGNGFDFTRRVTTLYSRLVYNRDFNRSAFSSHLSYYQSLDETKNFGGSQQPFKTQDISFRGNYAFDNKYIFQLDLAYTGSMRLPEGERFNLYPTVGAAWVASNETFLSGSSVVNYLKLYGSYGQMGVSSSGGYSIINGNLLPNGLGGLGGLNEFYLSQTLWQQQGGRTFGTFNDRSAFVNSYSIAQQGSNNYDLPIRTYLNLGVQTELFNMVSIEANYFHQNNSGEISTRNSQVPLLFGNQNFIPVTNFGETIQQGVDGAISVFKRDGDFRYSVGINAVYTTGKFVEVNEPVDLKDYRKLAGTNTETIRAYVSEGLFQSDAEISGRDVTQSWGDVQPGDIRYADINDDGVVNQEDIAATDFHTPRLRYGLNISMSYKGVGLFISGEGLGDGHMMLTNPNYFWITGTQRNYSEVMLDRYPETNDYPRLTTASQNNYQGSTFWLADASYLRVKNVELSYTVPESVSQNLAMSRLRIYVRAKNLFVVSELTDKYGISPESQFAGAGNFPMMRTFTGGISARF